AFGAGEGGFEVVGVGGDVAEGDVEGVAAAVAEGGACGGAAATAGHRGSSWRSVLVTGTPEPGHSGASGRWLRTGPSWTWCCRIRGRRTPTTTRRRPQRGHFATFTSSPPPAAHRRDRAGRAG